MPDSIGEVSAKVELDLSSLRSTIETALGALKGAALNLGSWFKSGGEEAEAALEGVGEHLNALIPGLSNVSGLLTGGLIVGLVGVAAAATEVGIQFDEASDRIRTGTGKTGEALAGLEENFKNVFSGVPSSAEDVATAIADLNTRMDLTGPALESLATQELNLARINREQLAPLIETTSQLFQNWGKDLGSPNEALDYLFKVSQSTGVSVTQLADQVKRNSPSFRAIGLDFKESAALVGQFEKTGVDAQRTLLSLSAAVSNLGKQGVTDGKEGLRQLIEQVKNADTDMQAAAEASTIFGQRAGVQMADAIRTGKFSVDEFVTSLDASSETINKASEDSFSFHEKLDLLKNSTETLLEPLGVRLLDGLEGILGAIQPLVTMIGGMESALSSLPAPVSAVIDLIEKLINPLTVIQTIVGLVKTAFASFKTELEQIKSPTAVFTALMIAVEHPVDVAKGAIDKITGTLKSLTASFTGTKEAVGEHVTAMGSLGKAHEDAKPKVDKSKSSQDEFRDAVDKAKDKIKEQQAQAKINAEAMKELGLSVDTSSDYAKKMAEEYEKVNQKLRDQKSQRLMDDAIAAFKNADQANKDWTRDLGALTDKVNDSVRPALNKLATTDVANLINSMADLKPPTDAYYDALQKLGIDGHEKLKQIADDAAAARDAILGSDVATDFEKKTAIYKALKAQVDASTAAGIQIPDDQKAMLAKLETELNTGKGKDVKTAAQGLFHGFSDALNQFTNDAAQSLWTGDTSFSEKFKKLAQDMTNAILNTFIAPVTTAINNFISGTLADLLGGKGFGGVKDALGNLGGLFKGGSGAAAGAASGAAQVGGAAAKVGGGAASAATSALQSAMGVAGAAGAVVGAISGIIGNFQMHGMGVDLGRIEESTRYTAIGTIGPAGIIDTLRTYQPWIEVIALYLYNVQAPWMAAVQDYLENYLHDRVAHLDGMHAYLQIISDNVSTIVQMMGGTPSSFTGQTSTSTQDQNQPAQHAPQETVKSVACCCDEGGGKNPWQNVIDAAKVFYQDQLAPTLDLNSQQSQQTAEEQERSTRATDAAASSYYRDQLDATQQLQNGTDELQRNTHGVGETIKSVGRNTVASQEKSDAQRAGLSEKVTSVMEQTRSLQQESNSISTQTASTAAQNASTAQDKVDTIIKELADLYGEAVEIKDILSKSASTSPSLSQVRSLAPVSSTIATNTQPASPGFVNHVTINATVQSQSDADYLMARINRTLGPGSQT